MSLSTPRVIDVERPVYDSKYGTRMSHLDWARTVARQVRRDYRFAAGSDDERDLEQTARLVVTAKAPRFDFSRVPTGGDPDMLFRGWVKQSVRNECQREAIRLKNAGTFNTTRTPHLAPAASEGVCPAGEFAHEERRRDSSPPSKGQALPLGDDPEVSYRMHAAGLTVEGEPDLAAWGVAVGRLAKQQNGALWALGDLVAYGEERFGAKVAKAELESTGYANESVRKTVYVSQRFPPGRRLPNLSWDHHRCVASLKGSLARKLLLRALQEKLSTRDLRTLVKGLRPKDESALRLPVTALERRITQMTVAERELLTRKGIDLDQFSRMLALLKGL